MWRFISIIIAFLIFILFIMFNLDNRSNVSFGFAVIEQAPVYLTALVSFVLGLACSLPVIFFHARKKSKGLLSKAEKAEQKKQIQAKKEEEKTNKKAAKEAAAATKENETTV
jgi:uncharacterized integral membrane protein